MTCGTSITSLSSHTARTSELPANPRQHSLFASSLSSQPKVGTVRTRQGRCALHATKKRAQFHASPLPKVGKLPLHWPQAERPGASNTFGSAVATPTDKRGFVTPKFWGGALAPPHGYGRDGATRKAARTAEPVLLTSCPPNARSKANGGFPVSFRS